MFQAFLLKYAEVGVKGKNRYVFEDALVRNVKKHLGKINGEFDVSKINGRIFVQCANYDYEETVEELKKVFGVVGICPVRVLDSMEHDDVVKAAVEFIGENYEDKNFSFKVETRRANKSYPIPSMTMDADAGEAILMAYPETHVDVHNPEVRLHIEIRETVFMYSKTIKGCGGMPLGTNGRALLLLSGGIDSPVAGYMVSRRGVELDAVYFNAPPYTSERAKQKVMDLARQISKWTGPIHLHIINFTDIQLYIYEKCPHDELTIIMRRYMMRIAEHIARENDLLGLITGESIGQVASQTMKSLYCTDEACNIPVYRPLIGFDKQDIIDLSEKIGTYETSILPYEDCCTIFVAKHPVTKPNINIIKTSETKLSEKIDELFKTAIETDEVILIGNEER
ncbi:thiamine biosynthesis protein ThiI [Lachnospiraceae bacterium KH1T2]|nr:thiamine biosynthesis protein ThiI [Lachnospiraceae bacterium KH1T2]